MIKNSTAMGLALARKDAEAMKGAVFAVLYQEFHPTTEEGQSLRALCVRLLYHSTESTLTPLLESIISDDDNTDAIAAASDSWVDAWNRTIETKPS